MLWGKAKHYFDKALAIKPSAKIYYELGLSMEKQGDKDTAYSHYREALALMREIQ
jgi:uncharacterized protein HemY